MEKFLLNLNPQGGILTTIVSFLMGIAPEFTLDTRTTIIFWFQISAFIVAIIAGTLTATNALLRYRDRKQKIKEQTKNQRHENTDL